jgi:hypothetical protein
MTANAGHVVGTGSSSTSRVKKIGSKASIAGTYVQLENDSFACGVFLVHDAGTSTTLFVAVGDSAPADDNGSIDLAIGGSIYLHLMVPSRVWVKRSSGSNTVTVRYITYV